MTEKSVQLIQMNISELTEIISNCVKAELQKINNVIQLNPQVESDELLSRKQTSELLGVSYTTLFNWNNDKTLPAQKMGNRVYYQRSIIMDKLSHTA
ncbi:helix-turn-helix transcriptional regulator [Flavobacterium sp. ZS1P14]|uniref:helix-turn-helix transcriptional regulator n=1 Tax=Flavobacterium sp. ZS1P14 TaxID=3401729 RepID=UPI003AACA67C